MADELSEIKRFIVLVSTIGEHPHYIILKSGDCSSPDLFIRTEWVRVRLLHGLAAHSQSLKQADNECPKTNDQ